jgi:hypothetical protein
MTTSIRRVKFTSGDLPDEREELARKSATMLGYHKLARSLVIPGTLLRAMRRLSIEPLTPSGVDDYKRRKARPGMWSARRQGLVWMAISIALCFGLVRLIRALGWGDGTNPAILFPMIFGSVGMGASLIRASYLFCTVTDRGSRITREWRRLPICEYAGTIPEFVLAKAIQLKAACPETVLTIDHLYEGIEVIERPTRDPFLVATLEDEEYYVDVWDEREYEAKL